MIVVAALIVVVCVCSKFFNFIYIQNKNGTSNLFTYLPTIPIDPEQRTPYTNGSGYYFQKQGNKILDIQACNVYDPTAPVVVAVCGNGVVEGAEVCDAGVNNRSTNICPMDPSCQASNSNCSNGYYCRNDCNACIQCSASCSQ